MIDLESAGKELKDGIAKQLARISQCTKGYKIQNLGSIAELNHVKVLLAELEAILGTDE